MNTLVYLADYVYSHINGSVRHSLSDRRRFLSDTVLEVKRTVSFVYESRVERGFRLVSTEQMSNASIKMNGNGILLRADTTTLPVKYVVEMLYPINWFTLQHYS